MRAINLLAGESRRSGVAPSLSQLGIGHLIVGLLTVGLVFVTLYVITENTISSREATLANLKQQEVQLQAEIARLNTYTQFEKLAQERETTVKEIAAGRFDWHAALSDLSKVMPTNVSLQALTATVGPGATAAGSGTATTSGSVRSDINAPAFELKGCTRNQDDVARLMSRLRLINGVSRVTLEDSAAGGAGSSSGGGCPASGPTFDMVVFFEPFATSAMSTTP